MARKDRRFAVRNNKGAWYAIDDRGDVVWTDSGMRDEMSARTARAVVDSYAESTRRTLKIVEVEQLPRWPR